MGIFDKLRSSAAPTFDVQRSIMTIIVAAVKSDDSVSEDEILRVRSICSGTQIFASNTTAQDDAVISFADNVTNTLGDSAIDHAAQGLKQELRETAFALACDMVLADGILSEREEAYLTRLASRLAIPEHVIGTVVEATIIRNRSA
jgi:uncharacterized tellurite resistance protein B-like protein